MEAYPQYIPMWLMIVCLSMLMISSLLNALYYTPILIRGWFYPAEEPENTTFRVSWTEGLPLIFLSLTIVLLFFFSHAWINPFIHAIAPLIPVESITSPF